MLFSFASVVFIALVSMSAVAFATFVLTQSIAADLGELLDKHRKPTRDNVVSIETVSVKSRGIDDNLPIHFAAHSYR